MANGHGGRRAGAGRKAPKETVEFRTFWRAWLESPEGRKHLEERVKKSDTLLAKIIDKCHPTPTELDISINRIPDDFVFRCEFTTRGGAQAPAAVPLPGAGDGEPGD